MKSNRNVGSKVVGGILTVATIGGLSGCAGAKAPLRNYMNSTGAQRKVLQEQDVAERTLKEGRVQEGHILYVPMIGAEKVLADEFGVDIGARGYNALFEGNAVEISYRNPRTGEIVNEVQKISNDCTIDTCDFGSFDACVPRSQLDNAITEVAKRQGIESVAVKEVDHPMTETSEFFTGKAFYLGEVDGHLISGGILAPTSLKAHRILLSTGIGQDANYVSVVMRVPKNSEGVDRVIAVAPAYDVLSGRTTMTIGHDDILIASGTNHYRDLRSFLQEAGGLVNDITGVSDAIQNAHGSIDRGLRGNYLDRNNAPKESGVQKAGRILGEINGVRGELTNLSQ